MRPTDFENAGETTVHAQGVICPVTRHYTSVTHMNSAINKTLSFLGIIRNLSLKEAESSLH